MKNKKYFALCLTFVGLFGAAVRSADSNRDLAETADNPNVGTDATLAITADLVNPIPANTVGVCTAANAKDKACIVNTNTRYKASDGPLATSATSWIQNSGPWGGIYNSPHFCYSAVDGVYRDGNPFASLVSGNTDNTGHVVKCLNCKSSNTSVCPVPAQGSTDANGFVVGSDPVVFDQGNDDITANGISMKGKFYRFYNRTCPEYLNPHKMEIPVRTARGQNNYNMREKDIESKEVGCWSPSYPIICSFPSDSSGPITKTYMQNLVNAQTTDEKKIAVARDMFGTRPIDASGRNAAEEVLGASDSNKDISNAYHGNSTPTSSRYKMRVLLQPDEFMVGTIPDGEQTDYIRGYLNGKTTDPKERTPATLTVNSWSLYNHNGVWQECLNPDFNYNRIHLVENESQRGLTKTTAIATKDVLREISKYDNSAIYTKEEPILPCGVFSGTVGQFGTNIDPRYTTMTDVSSGETIVTCANSGYIRIFGSLATGAPLYTRYKVYLPTGPDSYESASSHYLNVRACIQCVDINIYCAHIIHEIFNENGCAQNSSACDINKLRAGMKSLREAEQFYINNGTYDHQLEINGINDCIKDVERTAKDLFFR